MLKLKWQYKLFILAALLALLPALFISNRLISIAETELTSKINDELLSATDKLSDDLYSFFTDNYQKQLLIKKSVENDNLGVDEKISVMIASVEEIEEFLSIAIFFENGSSSFDMALQVNTEDMDVLIEQNRIDKKIIYGSIPEGYKIKEGESFELSPIKYIKELEYWIIHYVIPVNIPNAPDAYMLTTVKLNGLRQRLINDNFNQIGSLYIMDQAGRFILTKSSELPHSNFIIEDALEMLHGNSRITVVTNYSKGNNKIVASFAYPVNLNWVIIAELAEEDAYAAVSEMNSELVVWLIVVLALSLLAVFLFTNILKKPLSHLVKKAEEISKGNFDIEIDYKQQDPIGTLGNTLVGMSKSLKESFSKIEDQNKQLEEYSRSLEDKVTERTKELKETNEDLQKAYLQVLDLNKEKSEFLGIAAHDLKNPLGAIRGYGDLILDDKKMDRSDLDKYVSKIVHSSDRMFSIISSLLEVNKLEEGQVKVEISSVNLNLILKNVVANNAENAKKKNIKLNLKASEKSVFLESDELLLTQIIDNIVSNAIKFSPADKEVFITLVRAGERIIIKIKDQGPGFTDNDKKVLFSKFAKLSARPTGGEHSTGLGLSIVKKLVEMLDGSIKVESEQGQGAEFTLRFSSAI